MTTPKSFEGCYIYGCPTIHDLPGPEGGNGGWVPTTGIITVTTNQSNYTMQQLLDTVASQRQEIEMLKQAVALARSYMTPEQLASLRYMTKLLTEDKK